MRTLFANADWVFIGGKFAQGVDLLVEGGLIAEILPRGEPCPCDMTIDIAGKSLLPAFWDAHVHFFQTGIRAIEFDAGEYRTHSELFEGIIDWLATHDSINGYGYSPEGDGELPSREELDKISAEKPIFIRRVDGHSSCTNTKALEIFGEILTSAKGFDFERGHLSLEAQVVADRFMLASISDEGLRDSARAVAQEALSKGCASIGALIPSPRWVGILREIDLPIRTFPRLETLEPETARELGLPRVGGCMPMVDGAFGSRTAFLTEPYEDMPSHFGECEISQTALDDWFVRAGKAGLSTAVHAIGDGAVDMILRSIEGIPKSERPWRSRIEHAELLRDEQIEKIAEHGISLAVQPVFERLWGGAEGMYFRRLGERWRMTNRYRDLLDAGVVLAGSSDSYITPIDPLAGIFSAVEHPNANQAIRLEEAIEMFTIGAAKSEGEEAMLGEIAVGKSADLAVLSGNWAMGEIEVSATVVGGEIKFGKLS
ncbi:MAG TPA: hypothetical protein ENN07_08805 [candidate division Zixibacteria bacterium]|nr:hypothetical protein [candidate division Zixibacteria bacterium]